MWRRNGYGSEVLGRVCLWGFISRGLYLVTNTRSLCFQICAYRGLGVPLCSFIWCNFVIPRLCFWRTYLPVKPWNFGLTDLVLYAGTWGVDFGRSPFDGLYIEWILVSVVQASKFWFEYE